MNNMSEINTIIIFAFRYGLQRKTGETLMISSFIKNNINLLQERDIKEIIHDINLYEPHGIDNDWLHLKDWLIKYSKTWMKICD